MGQKDNDWCVTVQSIHAMHDWFEEVSVPVCSDEERCAAIEAIGNYYQRSLDIEACTVKLVYIHLQGAARDRILFIFHHLVMDAYSFIYLLKILFHFLLALSPINP